MTAQHADRVRGGHLPGDDAQVPPGAAVQFTAARGAEPARVPSVLYVHKAAHAHQAQLLHGRAGRFVYGGLLSKAFDEFLVTNERLVLQDECYLDGVAFQTMFQKWSEAGASDEFRYEVDRFKNYRLY